MKFLNQVVRGCRALPHVGGHPGTGVVVAFVAMGFVAGVRAGIAKGLIGALIMLAIFGPMYLWGAYDRAQLSDREARRRVK